MYRTICTVKQTCMHQNLNAHGAWTLRWPNNPSRTLTRSMYTEHLSILRIYSYVYGAFDFSRVHVVACRAQVPVRVAWQSASITATLDTGGRACTRDCTSRRCFSFNSWFPSQFLQPNGPHGSQCMGSCCDGSVGSLSNFLCVDSFPPNYPMRLAMKTVNSSRGAKKNKST